MKTRRQWITIKLGFLAVAIALNPAAEGCDTHFWLVRWARAHHKTISDDAAFLKSHPKIAARLDKKCEKARKHHAKPTPTPAPSPTPSPHPAPSPTPTPTPSPTPSPSPTPGCVMGPACWAMTAQWCEAAREPMLIGNVLYTETQLRQIFGHPKPDNGLWLLAVQVISAKIGIACNADPTCIASIVAVADMTIGSLVVPPIGDGFLPPGDVNNLVAALRAYNQGQQCAPLCEEE